MNVNVETTPAALGTLHRLLAAEWFVAPRRYTVSYSEDGGVVVTTQEGEYYSISNEGEVVRFYMRLSGPETVILD